MDLKDNTTISVSIVGDSEIRKLNKQYLDRDYPTDVLSFIFKEEQPDGTHFLGEVIVNKEQAARQAGEYGNTTEEEIAELVGHGVLHLLGVHHPHDDEIDIHGIKNETEKE